MQPWSRSPIPARALNINLSERYLHQLQCTNAGQFTLFEPERACANQLSHPRKLYKRAVIPFSSKKSVKKAETIVTRHDSTTTTANKKHFEESKLAEERNKTADEQRHIQDEVKHHLEIIREGKYLYIEIGNKRLQILHQKILDSRANVFLKASKAWINTTLNENVQRQQLESKLKDYQIRLARHIKTLKEANESPKAGESRQLYESLLLCSQWLEASVKETVLPSNETTLKESQLLAQWQRVKGRIDAMKQS